MQIINVNKMCYINQNNIAKVKERDIAISVTSLDAINGIEKGFINLTLAINNENYCCEYWGTYLLKEKDKELFFVSRIEVDVDLTDEELKQIHKEFDEDFKNSDITCVKVYDNKELIAVGIAFNQHNGYYSHVVEALENGTIIYENWL